MNYRTPYLIQRIDRRRKQGSPTADLVAAYQANQPRSPEQRAYINGLIPTDYMGSSEFEFGEVPKSLRRICDGRAEFTRFELTLSGSADNSWHKEFAVPAREVTLHGFCRREHRTDVKRDIALFATDRFEGRTKERVCLREVFGKVEMTSYRDGKRLRKPVVTLEASDLTAWFDIVNDWMVGTDKGQIDDVATLLGVPTGAE